MKLDVVVNRMAEAMQKVSQQTEQLVRGTRQPQIRYPLTLEEQVTRFLQHTPETFAYIAQTRGMDELYRYVDSMMKAKAYLDSVGGSR